MISHQNSWAASVDRSPSIVFGSSGIVFHMQPAPEERELLTLPMWNRNAEMRRLHTSIIEIQDAIQDAIQIIVLLQKNRMQRPNSSSSQVKVGY